MCLLVVELAETTADYKSYTRFDRCYSELIELLSVHQKI